jgi:hypothetical protein
MLTDGWLAAPDCQILTILSVHDKSGALPFTARSADQLPVHANCDASVAGVQRSRFVGALRLRSPQAAARRRWCARFLDSGNLVRI